MVHEVLEFNYKLLKFLEEDIKHDKIYLYYLKLNNDGKLEFVMNELNDYEVCRSHEKIFNNKLEVIENIKHNIKFLEKKIEKETIITNSNNS